MPIYLYTHDNPEMITSYNKQPIPGLYRCNIPTLFFSNTVMLDNTQSSNQLVWLALLAKLEWVFWRKETRKPVQPEADNWKIWKLVKVNTYLFSKAIRLHKKPCQIFLFAQTEDSPTGEFFPVIQYSYLGEERTESKPFWLQQKIFFVNENRNNFLQRIQM